MGVVAGLYIYDVVVKSSRLLSHLLMSSCVKTRLQRKAKCVACLSRRTVKSNL